MTTIRYGHAGSVRWEPEWLTLRLSVRLMNPQFWNLLKAWFQDGVDDSHWLSAPLRIMTMEEDVPGYPRWKQVSVDVLSWIVFHLLVRREYQLVEAVAGHRVVGHQPPVCATVQEQRIRTTSVGARSDVRTLGPLLRRASGFGMRAFGESGNNALVSVVLRIWTLPVNFRPQVYHLFSATVCHPFSATVYQCFSAKMYHSFSAKVYHL